MSRRERRYYQNALEYGDTANLPYDNPVKLYLISKSKKEGYGILYLLLLPFFFFFWRNKEESIGLLVELTSSWWCSPFFCLFSLRPRARAENAIVVLHEDMTVREGDEDKRSVEEYWSDFADSYFEASEYGTRLYVLDYSRLQNDFPRELSTKGLSALTKKIVKTITKLNVYDATLIAFGMR